MKRQRSNNTLSGDFSSAATTQIKTAFPPSVYKPSKLPSSAFSSKKFSITAGSPGKKHSQSKVEVFNSLSPPKHTGQPYHPGNDMYYAPSPASTNALKNY